MAKRYPRNISIFDNSLSLKTYSIKDTVSAKDSDVYQIQQTKYLVKKQNGSQNDLMNWIDQLSNEGWELIAQPINLGFYIFKQSKN